MPPTVDEPRSNAGSSPAWTDDAGETHRTLALEPVPTPDTVILENDVLVVVGFQGQIEHVTRKD